MGDVGTMNIRSYEDYQENIRPLEMLQRFNRLVKKNKPLDKDLYVPSCQKYREIDNKKIPIIIIESRFDGNFYEIPLSEIINPEDLKEIDFSVVDYCQCRYFQKLSIKI